MRYETVQAIGMDDFFTKTSQEKKRVLFWFKKNRWLEPVFKNKRLSSEEKLIFLEHFYFLLAHHVQFDMCLQECPASFSKKLRTSFYELKSFLEQGLSLKEALQKSARMTAFEVMAFELNELSGNLKEAFKNAISIEKEQKEFKSQLLKQISYPFVVLSLLIGILIFFSVYLIPQVLETFQTKELPLLTKIFIYSGTFLYEKGWELLAFMTSLFFICLVFFKKHPKFQPLNLLKNKTQGLYFLMLLYAHDLPLSTILKGLVLFEKNVGLTTWKAVEAQLEKGGSLSKALENVGFDSVRVGRLVAYGERTGDLKKFLHTAYFLEKEYQKKRIQAFLSLLNPFLLMVCALLLASLAYAMLTPLYDPLAGLIAVS